MAKAHLHEAIERFTGGVTLAGGERQILLFCQQRRRTFEEFDVMFLDGTQMRQQSRGEVVAALETEETGQRAERLAVGRQCDGLLVR